MSHRPLQGFSKILREFRGYLDLLPPTPDEFLKLSRDQAGRQKKKERKRPRAGSGTSSIPRSSMITRSLAFPRRLFDRVREAVTTVRGGGDAATLDRRKLTTRRSAAASRRRAPRR